MEWHARQFVFVLESERILAIIGMVFGEFKDKFLGYFLFINRIVPIPGESDDIKSARASPTPGRQ
jgi:hypothetical protein